ncbi:MAG TPA: S8 family serine peptidase, partial [Solirubrobacterales bacterium]
MRLKLALGAALAALLALLGAGAGAAGAASAIGQHHAFASRQLVVKFDGEAHGRTIGLPRGAGVLETARALRAKPNVDYAVPNFAAHASAVEAEPFDPDDDGTIEAVTGSSTTTTSPGGWATRQWDFLDYSGTPTSRLPISPGGINAVGAWANLEAEGRPGAQGIVVAVLDSGIAYRDYGSQYLRSPDFSPEEFVPGADFVDHDGLPLDENGHGTFVAATIAEQTNNGIGL